MIRKSLVCGLALLSLTACSEIRSYSFGTMMGWCHDGKDDVEYIDVQVDRNIDCEEKGYQLPKRSQRYESADYVITPEVYNILASRVAGKVLSDAPAIFANNPNAPIYIADMVQIDRYLPSIPDAAAKTSREILTNANMFNIVDNVNDAEFILESSLTNSNTPEVPVISYEMRLKDMNDNLLNSWTDTVRQVQNDDGSWW